MSCNSSKTSIDSHPLGDMTGVLVDVNFRLWMECPSCGLKKHE